MKNKKSLFIVLFAAVVALGVSLLTPGCETNSGGNSSPPVVAVDTNGVLIVFGNPVTTNAVETTMKLAGVSGATAAIQYDANSKAYLQAAAAVIDATLNSGNYDPVLLQTALQNISINEAHDPQVTAGINLALSSYSTFFGATVDQKLSDASIYLVPALRGFRDGILQVVGKTN